MALRRAASTTPTLFSKFLTNPLTVVRSASSFSRSFNTNTQLSHFDEDDDRHVDVDRRSDSSASRRRDFAPNIFSGTILCFSLNFTLTNMIQRK